MKAPQSLFLALIAGVLLGAYFVPRCEALLGPDEPPRRAVVQRGAYTEEELGTIEVFRRNAPAVAFITTARRQRDYWFGREFQVPAGQGSGFLWDEEGHVVTNYHVIQNADYANVSLHDGTDYRATLVGLAPNFDIAVLKIDAPPETLTPVELGSSRELVVGQTVYAIGNPYGWDQTLTKGVLSAIGRRIQALTGYMIEDVIQTDAAVNPGNSGGPLIDSAGLLIGMNTAIYSPSGTNAGIGFAVPVDWLNHVVPQLIAYGRLIVPSLGVLILPSDKNLRVTSSIGIPGVMVYEVPAGSAAALAGLRGIERDKAGNAIAGDVITEVDGERVTSPEDLRVILERHRAGDRVQVKARRGRQELVVDLVLEAPAE